MKTLQARIVSGLALVALTAAPAFAADSAKSVASQKSLLSEMLSRTSVKLSGEAYGPTLSDAGSRQLDAAGKKREENLSIYHSHYVEYAVGEAKAFKVFVNPRFFATPLFGGSYVADDLRIGVKNGSIYKRGNFNLYTKLDAKIPTTDASIDQGRLISPGITAIAAVDVPKTRLTLESWLMSRMNTYTTNNATDDKGALGFGFAQNVSYRLSPSLATSLYVEYYGASKMADVGAMSVGEEGLYAKTYLSWDVSSKVNLSPYLQFYPDASAGMLKTANAGFEFAATLF
ncbi:MAG: hypothetical protein IT285_10505 [Bdellovibrionales bacterium]|nr:hypothetical protein [Bdellovibrionales bacterium]